MLSKSAILSASIGLTLFALLLTGSLRVAATSSHSIPNPELEKLRQQGMKLFSQGSYYDARAVFLQASARARDLDLAQPRAMNLMRAAVCLDRVSRFRDAQKELERARDMARSSHSMDVLGIAENNLANLYLRMGQREKALEVATAALAGPEAWADRQNHGRLLYQQATALAETGRFAAAEPLYREAIEELIEFDDLASAASIEGNYGTKLTKLGRMNEAEDALSRGLWLERIHHLTISANILSGLAELRDLQGDSDSATNLFEEAVNLPHNTSPVWQVRSRRGRFRLKHGDLTGALEDFREARRVALEMRADMVPADQDRVVFESEFSLASGVVEGLVDAGNRLARKTGDPKALRETFDAAEQDRMWSLRALVPGANDWRGRLPDRYWELLAQYQTLERTAVAGRSAQVAGRISALQAELQRIEADAADDRADVVLSGSALAHAQRVLDDDSVLFSFLVTETASWVWAVDRGHVDVYPLPPVARIKAEADAFTDAVRRGDLGTPLACDLYRDLFGSIPERFLKHRRWLIEPDWHLNGLPFAALSPRPGEFLVHRAALESIPGALLLERGAVPANAPFLGVGDPIYNGADPRYRAGAGQPDLTLPRLPNTADELTACARAWGARNLKLLTGADATANGVQAALGGDAGIVHFATHVIADSGEFRSGLIALSLDTSGGMGLIGPKEIVARPVACSLVVMNGCHSAQGKALPATGLMGLTRAWIGAGAKAVIATQWDVPDAAAQSLMTDFYRALRKSPERGASFALREAQLAAIQHEHSGGGSPWAAYSLLSRMQ